jgi:[methyl-Co(III) methanol-specific corrinoid protein]:coenzyme M methyltransferase
MDVTGARFPQAHTDSARMADIAVAGHTILGMDVVMPLFSVCHEAAAMGCKVDWGNEDKMPESGKPIFTAVEDIRIPADLLKRPGCSVPLEAIGILKKRLGDSAAVCGKVFGPWTQGYHYFGVENFLMMTISEPDNVRQILERLLPVTLTFAKAQIEAGADCITLGDHATRDLCGPDAYRDFLKEIHAEIVRQIKIPIMLHICGDTSDRIPMIAQTGVNCFHWDTKTGSPAEVRKMAGDKMALIGGISNYMLLKGKPQDVRNAAAEAIANGIDIIGPECAIPLWTPLENLRAVVK